MIRCDPNLPHQSTRVRAIAKSEVVNTAHLNLHREIEREPSRRILYRRRFGHNEHCISRIAPASDIHRTVRPYCGNTPDGLLRNEYRKIE